MNITYWNDNNAVVFLANDIQAGQHYWETIKVNQGRENVIIHISRVAVLYLEIYGWMDRTNQQLSYYNTEFRSVQKQNRSVQKQNWIFDSLCEMYVLANGHTLWRNSNIVVCRRIPCRRSHSTLQWYASGTQQSR